MRLCAIAVTANYNNHAELMRYLHVDVVGSPGKLNYTPTASSSFDIATL